MASHKQIAHLWANKASSRGGTRGSLYSMGDTIYSYGSHFPIARHIINAQGSPAILFTQDSYSNSTAKHKGHVHKALRGLDLPIFYVPKVPGPGSMDATFWKGVFEKHEMDARAEIVKAKRARVHGFLYIAQAKHILAHMEETKAFFGLKLKVPTFASIGPDSKETKKIERAAELVRIRDREILKDREAQRIRQQAEQRVKDTLAFNAWRNGETDRCPDSFALDQFGSVYLRNAHKGEIVQTSRGAEVPIADAIRAFRFVKLVRQTGNTFQANGKTIAIGHFNVRSIASNGDLQIGCHFISWERIQEWALATGVFDADVSTEAIQETQVH